MASTGEGELPGEVARLRERVQQLEARERELEARVEQLEDWLDSGMTRALNELVEMDERYRLLLDEIPLLLAVHRGGHFVFVNGTMLRSLGYDRADELVGQPVFTVVHPDHRREVAVRVERSTLLGEPQPYLEQKLVRRDGSTLPVDLCSLPLVFDREPAIVVFAHDLSERHRFEEQLRQTSRMEAVGRLAGGVAHDFNNLLSIILHSVHFLLDTLGPDDPARVDAEQIHAATRRATALTRQLLTFSRGAEPSAGVLDVNAVVRGLAPLLVGTLGEVARLDLDLAVVPCRVKMARDHLEQILVNLSVNARDAMATGGRLVIRTRIGHDESLGRAVHLIVSDDGAGMSPDVAAHAFEPFFTTKPAGKGTGLGLAITYGIVRKAGGRITLESAPGQGSLIAIVLPESDSASQPSLEAIVLAAPPGAGECILVVEDDEGVRLVLERVLREQGYRVVAAPDADQALALLGRAPREVDLLLTDVILPQRSGPELARLAQACCPGLRVLFMSGYTAGELARSGLAADDGWLLHKPFDGPELAAKVRAALAAPPLAVPAD